MNRGKSRHIAHFLSRLIDALLPYSGEDGDLANLLEESLTLKADCLEDQLVADDETSYFRLELARLVRTGRLKNIPDVDKAAQTLLSVFAQLDSERNGS